MRGLKMKSKRIGLVKCCIATSFYNLLWLLKKMEWNEVIVCKKRKESNGGYFLLLNSTLYSSLNAAQFIQSDVIIAKMKKSKRKMLDPGRMATLNTYLLNHGLYRVMLFLKVYEIECSVNLFPILVNCHGSCISDLWCKTWITCDWMHALMIAS